MFIWQMKQERWERNLEHYLDEILEQTNLKEERLQEIVKILRQYEVVG